MANNYVEKLEDFEHLAQLLELSVLDLSNNHIEDQLIVDVLSRMPDLRVLNLMGNPVIRKIPAYRKTMILSCKNLQYLDDRPVFPRERACAEAWERGGMAEENAERQRWIDRERQRIMDSVNDIIAIRDRHIEERRRQCDSGHGTSVGDSESDTENIPDDVQDNEAMHSPIRQEHESSSEESDDEQADYNYAGECEREEQSPSESDAEDDFMTEKQIDPVEYADYRGRIFDFTRKEPTRRLLVEEIEDCNAPSTSSLNSQNKYQNEKDDIFNQNEVNTNLSVVDNDSNNEGLVKGTREKDRNELGQSEPNPEKIINQGNIESDNEGKIKAEVESKDSQVLNLLKNDLSDNVNEDMSFDKYYLENKLIMKQNAIDSVRNMDLTDSTLTFEEFLEKRSLEEIEVQKQIENSMKTNNECVKISEMGGRVAEKKRNQSVTESSNINTSKLTREDIREIMDKEVKKMTKDTTIQNILWENVEVKVSDPCESDESDGSFERFEDQFYRQMDRIDSTKAENVTAQGDGPAECNLTANVKTREELKKVLTAEPKELNEEEREYREMLKWDLRLPEQNIPILKPIERKESESEDTMIEMLIKCQKEVKPEFEITAPKDIAEENDVILYPKNMDSINCPKYRSMYTEMDKKIEDEIVKTPQVYKKLNMSQNYSVFQKNQEKIVKGGEEEEEHVVENALIAANKISEVRDQMSDFTRKLAEFNEQSRQAKEEVMRDYNAAVEKELIIVNKIMEMNEKAFMHEKCSATRKLRGLDEIERSEFRKHFADMGILMEDDEEEIDEFMKCSVPNEKEEDLDNDVIDEMSQQSVTLGENTINITSDFVCTGSENFWKTSANVETYKNEEYYSKNEDSRQHSKSVGEPEEGDDHSGTDDFEEYFDFKKFVEDILSDESDPDTETKNGDMESENSPETQRNAENEVSMEDGYEDPPAEKTIKRTVKCSLEMQLAKEAI